MDFRVRYFDVLDIFEVHDGDTYALLLDKGFRDYGAPWLRLKGYSCPELTDAGGPEARDGAESMLRDHLATAYVKTEKIPPSLAAKLAKRYGDSPKSLTRYLATIYLDDTLLLGDALVTAGLARVGSFIH